jgi:4,5-DOPA dioxygenase extradiol
MAHFGPDVALRPTPEHYLPLLYALGARRAGDKIHIFNDEVTCSLSMLSVTIG